jgi:hypothetical protein
MKHKTCVPLMATLQRPKRERDGVGQAMKGAASFPPLQEMAEQFCAVAATRDGEGEYESS